jgi:hypothetical protein
MVCLDNLPPHEIACLMVAYAKGEEHSELTLNSGQDVALPPALAQVSA